MTQRHTHEDQQQKKKAQPAPARTRGSQGGSDNELRSRKLRPEQGDKTSQESARARGGDLENEEMDERLDEEDRELEKEDQESGRTGGRGGPH